MPTEDEILKFSQTIEHLAKTSNLTIMDSIIAYCEKYEIEIETASSLISQKLKQRIRQEAQELNLLPKANTLPV